MRKLLFVFGILFGFLVVNTGGNLDFGVPSAAAFNPLKYCTNKCVNGGYKAIKQCKQDECSKLKSKSKKARCEKKCDKPGGLLQYCDSSCKTAQVCEKGPKMKACMKEQCDPYKKSDIHRYIKCKNKTCAAICQN